jgi:hypothetical protein
MERHCGHCEKTLENDSLSRFYFEDDSWLCVDCFGPGTSQPTHGDTRVSDATTAPRPTRGA